MKAHRTDLVSFAFGLLFLALSAWWLLAQLLGLALPPVGWFLAGALILIGVFGLVGALRSGRSGRPEPSGPEPTGQAVATEPAAPVSGASAPTSGAGLPPWDAAGSTWDASVPGSMPEAPTAEVRAPEAPTGEMRTPETPTAEVIHPAWLAHSAPEQQTAPISGQPGDGADEATSGIPARPAGEPTRVEPVGDRPADEREEQRRDS